MFAFREVSEAVQGKRKENKKRYVDFFTPLLSIVPLKYFRPRRIWIMYTSMCQKEQPILIKQYE